MLGFTAQQTLNYAQSLYEKKLITYPRTDSRFLTEDMAASLPGLVSAVAGAFSVGEAVPVHAEQVINNSKVSDHHAIIPTVNVVDADFGELPSGEQKVLSLITARLLSALGNPAVRNEVDVEFTCADTVFRAKAKNIREKGWRDIQEWIMGGSAESTDSENDRKEKSENADMLACIATLTNGKSYPLQNPKMEEGKTTPEKHFTEDSLLSAMERAGADEMPEEVERKGIGTSATRAATIEKLVRMNEIEGMITELVRTYKIIEDAEVLMHPVLEEIGVCPCCV